MSVLGCGSVLISKQRSLGPFLRFGTSLKVLRVHQPEKSWSGRYHGFISAPELVQLSNGLIHLEELAIDVAREQDSDEWPYPMLDAIAGFKSVRSVEIWLPLGGDPPARTPSLTVTSARLLFNYLRARTENLQRAIFHSGAPPYWHEQDEKSWAARNSITLMCDRAFDYGIMEDSPDKVREDEPARMQCNMIALKVALDGPLTKDEWDTWKEEQSTLRQQEHLKQSRKRQRLIMRPLKCIWKGNNSS
ncbi:hypothetical protein BX600DRAFT_436414 [Xylariales sp. PMI_506]|nr:hypothetical protein BX600DRAFT_436414 [Xylariales sp. PMI_506]